MQELGQVLVGIHEITQRFCRVPVINTGTL